LPIVPRAIAVVTSRSAAALQDVIDTASRRWAGCRLLLFDVRVQGENAAPQIARAIRSLSENGAGLGIEAVILTRGGGSIEDLWAFNEREVVDALFDCELPVVAAIGHETDTTLAELVADMRCATPTQAAMTLIPDSEAMAEQIAQLHHRLGLALRRQAQQARQHLDALGRHPLLTSPGRLVAAAEHRLDTAAHRLHAAIPRRFAPQHTRLDHLDNQLCDAPRSRLDLATTRLDALQRTLDAVSPQHVLARGFTMTLDAEGRPIREVDQAREAAKLTTVFQDGRVDSIPENKGLSPTPDKSTPTPRPPRRLKPYRKPGDEQPTLFA
jgi:exodeoxyribonuclease VII large subunit